MHSFSLQNLNFCPAASHCLHNISQESSMNAHREPAPVLSFGRAMALVFLPFACGYFFSYFFRAVNAVVSPDLIRDVGLSAADLGLLSAAYFFTFAFAQIPLGVLLDRFGPRRVQGTLYCLAGLGAFLFSLGESMFMLTLSRGLIGIGVSGGLMAALKAIVQWFPRDKIALINGLYFVSGSMGALAATTPLEWALRFSDWRGLFAILGATTIAAGLGIVFIVPDKPGGAVIKSLQEQIGEIGKIYRDSYFWRIAPLMFTCGSANMAIQGLWAAPWLAEVEGLGRAAVASHLFVMAVAMVFGAMLSGVMASALQRFGLSLATICGLAAALTIVVFLVVTLRIFEATYVLWAMVGFVGIQTSVVFAAMAHHFPESVVGRANTACNVLVFAMAFVYQFGIGMIVERWPADAQGAYPELAYRTAFLATIATQLVAWIWFVVPLRRKKK